MCRHARDEKRLQKAGNVMEIPTSVAQKLLEMSSSNPKSKYLLLYLIHMHSLERGGRIAGLMFGSKKSNKVQKLEHDLQMQKEATELKDKTHEKELVELRAQAKGMKSYYDYFLLLQKEGVLDAKGHVVKKKNASPTKTENEDQQIPEDVSMLASPVKGFQATADGTTPQ
jgi:hypothetical protein